MKTHSTQKRNRMYKQTAEAVCCKVYAFLRLLYFPHISFALNCMFTLILYFEFTHLSWTWSNFVFVCFFYCLFFFWILFFCCCCCSVCLLEWYICWILLFTYCARIKPLKPFAKIDWFFFYEYVRVFIYVYCSWLCVRVCVFIGFERMKNLLTIIKKAFAFSFSRHASFFFCRFLLLQFTAFLCLWRK